MPDTTQATNSSRCSAAGNRSISSRSRRCARGVEELRVWDETGTYRVVYIARLPEAVYVLHAFQKKTQATSSRDVEVARNRHAELMRGRR